MSSPGVRAAMGCLVCTGGAGGTSLLSPVGRQRSDLVPRRRLQLRGGEPSLWQILLNENRRPLPTFRILNSGRRAANSGSKQEADSRGSRVSSWDGVQALAVTEGACIVVAAASYGSSVYRKQQDSFVASSSAGAGKLGLKIGDVSTWYVPALWAALVINAVLRFVQRKHSTKTAPKEWEPRSIRDFSLDQRVGKLEEDVQETTTTSRMLARHLEKLGVRFRATKRTLRDPVRETVELAEKASQVVKVLAHREEVFERELQKTQQVLVSIQDQQAKQLNLLVAGMSKTSRSQRALEERILKEVSQMLGESTQVGSTGSALRKEEKLSSEGRKQELKKDTGSFWSSWLTNDKAGTGSSSVVDEKLTSKQVGQSQPSDDQRPVGNDNGLAVVTLDDEDVKSKRPAYDPDTSFKKQDFWAASPNDTSSHQATPEIEKAYTPGPQHQSSRSTGKMDGFSTTEKVPVLARMMLVCVLGVTFMNSTHRVTNRGTMAVVLCRAPSPLYITRTQPACFRELQKR